jgi:minor extracellular serine protease Vpr
VTPDNPAKTGEILVMYLTGPPQLLNTPLTGVGAPLPPDDAITVELPRAILTTSQAGQGLSVLYSGLASGFVGLWQVNVQIGSTIPAGDNVRLRLATGDSVVIFPLPITE